MREFKFKKYDRVINLQDDEDNGLSIGDIGTVDEDNSEVPYILWDKGIRQAQVDDEMELITEENENIVKEYKWYEAVEMVLSDEGLELETPSCDGHLISKLGMLYFKYKNGDTFETYITSNFINYTWTIVKPKLDLSTLKIDDKVVVWNNNSASEKCSRHFAGLENGRITTFNNGKTSFTVENLNQVSDWDNCELYTEES